MSHEEWTTVVQSHNKALDIDWAGLRHSRDLIFLFVRRTFVAKYKQTVLGPAWAIIQPFFTTVVYSIFFGNIAGLGAAGIPNFIFYLSGTIAWTLFASCLVHTADTFISNAGILGKVYFPRLVMPIANSLSQFIAFFIQFVFMLCFWGYYLATEAGLQPNWCMLLTPLVLVQLSMLGMGCGTIISSLTTKYRDLTMMVGFGVTLWSYCSPVAYDMFSRAPLQPGGSYYALYMLNPVTSPINMFRYAWLGSGGIDWFYYGLSWASTFVIFAFALALFSRVEKTFMDTI